MLLSIIKNTTLCLLACVFITGCKTKNTLFSAIPSSHSGIHFSNDIFENVLIRMRTFASSILEAKNIDLTFTSDSSLSGLKLSMEQRKNLFLIFKESVNNVAKYSKAKHCTISLKFEGNRFEMKINDDGTGFDTHAESSGNGLFNMKKRGKELNGNLSIASNSNEGTQVYLYFITT